MKGGTSDDTGLSPINDIGTLLGMRHPDEITIPPPQVENNKGSGGGRLKSIKENAVA